MYPLLIPTLQRLPDIAGMCPFIWGTGSPGRKDPVLSSNPPDLLFWQESQTVTDNTLTQLSVVCPRK